MYCSKCGREIRNDDSFCPFCGEKTAYADSGSEQKDDKSRKTKLALVVIPLILIVAGVVAYCLFFSVNTKTIDLCALATEPEASGYDGFGEIYTYAMDDNLNQNAVDEYLSSIKNDEERQNAAEFLDTVWFECDKDYFLSNGDIVTITANYDEAMALELELEISGITMEYEVCGLTEEDDALYKYGSDNGWFDGIGDFIIDGSDSRYINDFDLYTLDSDEAQMAVNEIYARHGYIFNTSSINNYFENCDWYKPMYTSDEFSESWFNRYEKSNVASLKAWIEELEEYATAV